MKIFTIMSNSKIYKVKAKDEDCAMKAVQDDFYNEKGLRNKYNIVFTEPGSDKKYRMVIRGTNEDEAKENAKEWYKDNRGIDIDIQSVSEHNEENWKENVHQDN